MSNKRIVSLIMAVLLLFSNVAWVAHAQQESEYHVMITSINPEGGNALVASPVPNASFKAYWVQLGANDDIDSLMLEVVNPSNPNLEYQPANRTQLSGLVDTRDGWTSGILIKVFENGALRDTLALYVSSMPMPSEPPQQMPPEQPQETEQPQQTETPTTEPEPASATVAVRYVDGAGATVAESSQTLTQLGTNTVYADTSLLPQGYRLADADSKQVELQAGGVAVPSELVFAVEKEQAALNASLYVTYVDENGTQISQESVTLTQPGVNTIQANLSLLPEGYELAGESTANVELYADNTLSQSSVTFQVKKTQPETPQIKPVEINISYITAEGEQAASEKETLSEVGTHTIHANPALVPDYDIVGESTATVELYADNTVSLDTVSFQVKKKAEEEPKINPVTVAIRYVDEATGKDIHDKTEVSFDSIGEHSVADKRIEIQNYSFASASAESVWVFEDGHAEPTEVVFSYRANEAPDAAGKTIPVKYQTANGKEVAPSHEENIVEGENTIQAKVTEVEGYTMTSPASQTVTLYPDGSVSAAQVIFEFKSNTEEEPAETEAGEETSIGEATVNVASVNIRKKVGSNGDIIKKLTQGTKVTVLEFVEDKKGEKWAKIQYEGKKIAYVKAEFLTMAGTETPPPVTIPENTPSAEPETTPTTEPEATATAVPEDTQAPDVSARLQVEFLEGSTVLYQYEEVLQGAGAHTISPRQAPEVSNYTLQGEVTQVVNVAADGSLDKAKISFQFVKKAISANVTVHYTDMKGQQIAADTVQSYDKAGDYTIEPQSTPKGYVLQEPKSYEVYVNESGVATPADVTFKFDVASIEGKVEIAYKDTKGATIAESTIQTLNTVGKHTIVPAALLTDYELEGLTSQEVTLNQDGTVTPAVVTFTYKKKQQQVSGSVTLHYIGPEGTKIAADTTQTLSTVGTQNIFPNIQIPEGFQLDGEGFYPVTLSADGNVNPSEITFTYKLKNAPANINAEVIVRYVDSKYFSIAEDDVVRLTSVGKHTISPLKTFNNYTLQQKTHTVEVNNQGFAVPQEVLFVYEQVIPKEPAADVQIHYVDQNGTQIAPSTTQRINVLGNNTVIANPSGLPSYYQLVGNKQVTVVLNADSTATPSSVVFVYKNINDNFESYHGFALTNTRVALRSSTSTNDSAIAQMLERNTLLYIAGQTQANGILYHSVQTLSGAGGFITDSDITKITQKQAQPYIDAYNQQNSGGNPPKETAITGYATTRGMDVPLRQLASGYSQILQIMPTGAVMYLSGQMETNDGYTWRVAQYNGKLGYVRSDQIRALTQSEVNTYLANNQAATPSNTAAPTFNPNNMSSYGYVTTNNVNFRTQPSKSSKVITKVQRYGLGLVKESRVENGVTWYKINFSGREGYVQGDFFKQLTLHEFNQFINSSEYRAGLQNNSGGNNGSGGTTGTTGKPPKVNPGKATPGNVQTLEGYNIGKWKNPNLAQASYPPFMPNITAMPTTALGADASPSPTMIVLDTSVQTWEGYNPGKWKNPNLAQASYLPFMPNSTASPSEFGAGTSASPGISTSPNPDDSAVTEKTDSSSSLLGILGISVVAIGGAAGYTVYAKNKRKKMISQAKARQAQMQVARQGGHAPGAAQHNGSSPNVPRDPFANPNGLAGNNFSAGKPGTPQMPNHQGNTSYAQRKPLQDDMFKKPPIAGGNVHAPNTPNAMNGSNAHATSDAANEPTPNNASDSSAPRRRR